VSVKLERCVSVCVGLFFLCLCECVYVFLCVCMCVFCYSQRGLAGDDQARQVSVSESMCKSLEVSVHMCLFVLCFCLCV
jgi:ABC-type sulfate transport system permease component